MGWEHLPVALTPWSSTDLAERSRRLTRSLTIYDSLERLGFLHGVNGRDDNAVLRCHVIGSDHHEGSNLRDTAAVFAPLCALLRNGPWSELHLLLCGPNCAPSDVSLETWHSVPPPPQPIQGVEAGTPALRVYYSQRVYDECLSAHTPPQLALAFNAGIWGYDSWGESVQALLRTGSPLVITSYNSLEAEDDEDTLQAMHESSQWQWLWRPCPNPWGSLAQEVRAVVQNAQFENSATQCLTLKPTPQEP